MTRGHPPYEYQSLAETVEAQDQAYPNVYAVVAAWTEPERSRGTDMFMTLSIIDPSTISESNAHLFGEEQCLSVQVFAATPDMFPQIRKVGDIVRLHRVKRNFFHGKHHLVATIKANFPVSYALFDGGNTAAAAYQTSHPNSHVSGAEVDIRANLADWFSRNYPHGDFSNSLMKSIEDLPVGTYFDLHCQVLHVDLQDPEDVIIYVWDGTDAKPFPPDHDTSAALEGSPAAAVRQIPVSVLRTPGFPMVGTALPVVVSPGALSRFPQPRTWVKLRNVGLRYVQGQPQAIFHQHSRWIAWDGVSGQKMAAAEGRRRAGQVARWGPEDPAGILTRQERFHRIPLRTLREALAHPGSASPVGKFRCLAKVLGYTPRDARQFCSSLAVMGGSWGRVAAEGEYVYTLQLMLEDATARVPVLLYGPEGERFFSMPASDLRVNNASRESVEARMNRLLGADVGRDSRGVWVQVCLKSYCVDRARPWETRQFQIFDTALI